MNSGLRTSYKSHLSDWSLDWIIWVAIIAALCRFANPEYLPYLLFFIACGLIIRICVLSQYRIELDEKGFTYKTAWKKLRFDWLQIRKVEAKWLLYSAHSSMGDRWSKYLLVFLESETDPWEINLVHFRRKDLKEFIGILKAEAPQAIVDEGFLDKVY